MLHCISGLSLFNLLSKKIKPITSNDVTPIQTPLTPLGPELIKPSTNELVGAEVARGLDPTGTYRTLQGNKA